ncbi:hypothetical protein [Chitinophaga sp. S165]|uniref:hypothetical protein n=1 Tax=Chitinophaga sp. S165 TaxID=2135462 RepID=UPI000D71548B|nr:hypothetical protein [Chitinophaga sp. S165]PWV48344.1 hypothetical protein C7475_107252 [Chitinophaga sp. S165]
MGKYLQDIMFSVDQKDFKRPLTTKQQEVLSSMRIIEDLFNLFLPKKIDTGRNVFRYIVKLNTCQEKDLEIDDSFNVLAIYVYFNFDQLMLMNEQTQLKYLLELLSKGLRRLCQINDIQFHLFQEVEEKIIANGFVFNSVYKEKKVSPDKKHEAQMNAYFSKERKELYVEVSDRKSNNKLFLLGNFDFRNFDRIKWDGNTLLNVYHINEFRSYKSKKVAEDYHKLNIETGEVVYHPVTREYLFTYGVELLTGEKDFERGLEYIKQAKQLGHGKAENILRQLEINPAERNKSVLLQQPKRRIYP